MRGLRIWTVVSLVVALYTGIVPLIAESETVLIDFDNVNEDEDQSAQWRALGVAVDGYGVPPRGPCNGTPALQGSFAHNAPIRIRIPRGATQVAFDAGDFGISDMDTITLRAFSDDAMTNAVGVVTHTVPQGVPDECVRFTVTADVIKVVEISSVGFFDCLPDAFFCPPVQDFPNSIFVDNLEVDLLPRTFTLFAGPGRTRNDAGTASTAVTPGGETTARFPLGSAFLLELTDANGASIESRFTLEAANVENTAGDTLFPNNVVIEFERSTSSTIKYFQAVHRGNVVVNITPTDSSIQPLRVRNEASPQQAAGYQTEGHCRGDTTVSPPSSLCKVTSEQAPRNLLIEVAAPARLGSAHNELDTRLSDLGHRRGIPPHFLKGQVQRESDFNPQAYRYEPLSIDLAYMSTCFAPFVPGVCDLRRQQPYALYRLATADGLQQGRNILTADITPRSLYCIFERDGVRRGITDADQLVSTDAIFAANDVVPRGDPSGCVSRNWRQSASRQTLDALRRDQNLLNFTAQTPLAASYGLLQILYPTAIAPMGWQGVNRARNPSLLLDTQANLDAGGGSLILGSGYLQRIFLRANPAVSVDDPDFTNQDALERVFRRAFNYYNGQRERDLDTAMYGPAVLNFGRTFLPISTGPIFP